MLNSDVLNGAAPDASSTLGASAQADNPTAAIEGTQSMNQAAPADHAAPQAQQPAPASTPRPWAQILKGALDGFQAASGAKNAGQAAMLGVKGELQQEQTDKENAMAQQQLQFQSVAAADSHIKAMHEAAAADAAGEDHKVTLVQHQQDVNEYALEHGLPPVFQIKGSTPTEMNAQAKGGLQTLADANGGTVPGVATTNAPATSADPSHTINVYTATPQDVQKNPTGVNKLINDARAADGLPPLDAQTITLMGGQRVKGNAFAGVAQMAQEAQQRLFTVPAPSNKSDENAAISAHLQQQLDSYKQSANADPSVIKLLQTQLTTFNSAAENARAKASIAQSNTTLENAPANAEAKAQEKTAEVNAEAATPTGKLNTAEKQSNIAKNNEELQEKRDENVVAWDPTASNSDGTKGANVVIPRAQAEQARLEHYKADPSTINSTIGGFNDVQNKINMLAAVANDPSRMSQVQAGLAAAMLAHGKGIEVGAFHTTIDTSRINEGLYAEDVKKANQTTRDYVAAMGAAHEAITQLPRLQTFGKSSRMTQQQMEAAQNMLPQPGDDAGMAQQKMTSLQTTLDPLRKQLPRMQGAELIPTWMETQGQTQQAQAQQRQQQLNKRATHAYNPTTRQIESLIK
jgi:hypothetical protein